MNGRWRDEIPHLLLLAAMFAIALLGWTRAPDRVPVHWDLHGEVDRWGGRFEGVLLLPLASAGVYLLLRFLPRVDPGRANYAQFSRAYSILRFTVLAFLALLYAVTQANLHGLSLRIERVMPFALGLLLLVFGALLGKIRPNWFVGIRTPWTLSSKAAWVKTHRLGGWLFLIVGTATLAIALVHPGAATIAGLAGSVVAAAACLVYSYRIWRDDPDKLAAAGTLPGEDGAGQGGSPAPFIR